MLQRARPNVVIEIRWCLAHKGVHRLVLVVPAPNADGGLPVQGVSGMGGAAKDPVGGGVGGKREVEEPVEDPGSTGRWEVWAGGAGFPLFYGCWKAGAD